MSEDQSEDEEEDDKEEDKEEQASDEEAKPEMSEDEDKEEEEEDKEESDEALKSEYATIVAKMESRGLIQKEESQEVQKSETKVDQAEELKKSIDERFDTLAKAVQAIAEKVEKIAAQPAPRKGAAGYQPLKKTEEEGQALNKAEVVNKLLELKKSGKNIPTEIFMRVETGRTTESDIKFIKGILG
jgi:hypothetical protein